MALAKDSSGSKTFLTSGGANPTYSFNNVAGNKLIVFVEAGTSGGLVPTSVTYNSVAMTAVANANEAAEGIIMSAWYLDSPATGTNTLQANFSAAQKGAFFVISFSGAGTGISTSGTHVSGGTSTNPTIALTVPTNGGMVMAGFCNSGGIVQNQGTLEINITQFQGEYLVYSAPVSGSTTLGVNQNNGLFGQVAFTFGPAAGPQSEFLSFF